MHSAQQDYIISFLPTWATTWYYFQYFHFIFSFI